MSEETVQLDYNEVNDPKDTSHSNIVIAILMIITIRIKKGDFPLSRK